MIGRRLSHYDIVEEISRGGMGVVYRAIDVNLGREVAVKVLPEELVHDPARRERLLQEARAASSLEHPHIAVIHEVGDADGVMFIAMELIRGEKLSALLGRGRLPLPRALTFATEIAEALARSHEHALTWLDSLDTRSVTPRACRAKGSSASSSEAPSRLRSPRTGSPRRKSAPPAWSAPAGDSSPRSATPPRPACTARPSSWP